MGRLRRKSSSTKEGGSTSRGQTAIDHFFSKGPAPKAGLFTQVGLPARRGPSVRGGKVSKTKTSERTTTNRTKGNTTAPPEVPSSAITVVPETQLTSPPHHTTSAAAGFSHRGAESSDVIVISDTHTQAAGTLCIAEFSDDDGADFVMATPKRKAASRLKQGSFDDGDFVTTTPKQKVTRKLKQASFQTKMKSNKLSLRGRVSCKENVAKYLGKSGGKRSANVLEDVSSRSPDNVPGEEGSGCGSPDSVPGEDESGCGSPEVLNQSLVIEPVGNAWTSHENRNDPISAVQKHTEGSTDNSSVQLKQEHTDYRDKSSPATEQQQDSPLAEEAQDDVDSVAITTLVQSESPEIAPEVGTRARVQQNIRPLATRTEQNTTLATEREQNSPAAIKTEQDSTIAAGTKQNSTIATRTKQNSSIATKTEQNSSIATKIEQHSTIATRTKQNSSIATKTEQNSTIATRTKQNSNNSVEQSSEIVDKTEKELKPLDKETSGSQQEKTSLGGKRWLSWTGSLLGKRSPTRGSSPVGKRSRTPDGTGTQVRRGNRLTCKKNLSAQMGTAEISQGHGEQVRGEPQGQGQHSQVKGEASVHQSDKAGERSDVSEVQGKEGMTEQEKEEIISPHSTETVYSSAEHEETKFTKIVSPVKSSEGTDSGETAPAREQTDGQTEQTALPEARSTGTDGLLTSVAMPTDNRTAPVAMETEKVATSVATETDNPTAPVAMGTGNLVTSVAMATADPMPHVQQTENAPESPDSSACWEDLNDSFFANLPGGASDLVRSFSEMSPFKERKGTSPPADPTLGSADVCNKFSRFRVQGVDAAEHDGYVSQLTLQLTSPAHRGTRTCVLQDGWATLCVQPGDIVHVLAEFGPDGVCTVDRDHGFVVVTPDLLISSTAVANGIKCLRRAVLSERFKGTDGSSKQMLLGTILHDVFQTATSTSFGDGSLKQISQQALQKQRHLRDMFSLSLTQAQLQGEIAEYLPVMRSWADTFYRTRGADMEVKLPGRTYRNRGDERSNVTISAVRDIEENVWAPRFGLKGKLDVTTEVRIQPRVKGRDPQVKCQDPLRRILPLELKTGRETNSIEHRSQVILYTLLTREQHPDPELGLLLYLKTGSMKAVPAGHVDRRELLLLRNRLASQLKHLLIKEGEKTVPSQLPPVINDPRGCKYCSQLGNCALYNRTFETPDSEGGMSDLLSQQTAHLKTSHLQYFSHWYLLVMLEHRETQHKSHLSHLWCTPAQDREKSGDCVHGLQLDRCAAGVDGDFTCTFRRKLLTPSSQPMTSLRLCVDDYILVSVEARNMVAMCTGFLCELGDDTLTVRVDRDLSKFPSDTVFTLDKKDGYVSTATSLANLSRLMATTATAERLRELIVEQREPQFHTRVSDMCPPHARDTIGKILKGLNQPQKQAIKKVLMARDYTLIVGMPGTGKTTSIVALVRILLACGNSVLLTSYTNSAVDNVLLKLTKFKIDFLRLGSSSRVHPGIAPYTDDQLTRGLTTVADLDKLYMSKPVVATTCLGAKHALFSRRKFDVCIVDEASQISQPVCLGPLFHAGRFVLVGDHQQLPPLVQSGAARRLGMDESLFKKMGRHESATAQLNVQYRMNSDIMLLSNTLMYDGKLRCGSDKVATATLDLPAWAQLQEVMSEVGVASSWIREALRPEAPVRFLDTDKVPAVETCEQGGLSNRKEAQLVRTLTAALFKAGCLQEDIGIIAPYRRQLRVLSELLQGAGCPGTESSPGERYPGVEINTVDKYQGRDKRVILVSFVRSNTGGQLGELLQDWRRLNVAITRAKHKLLLIGSASTLRRYEPVARLLEHLSANQMVLQLPPGADSAWGL